MSVRLFGWSALQISNGLTLKFAQVNIFVCSISSPTKDPNAQNKIQTVLKYLPQQINFGTFVHSTNVILYIKHMHMSIWQLPHVWVYRVKRNILNIVFNNSYDIVNT